MLAEQRRWPIFYGFSLAGGAMGKLGTERLNQQQCRRRQRVFVLRGLRNPRSEERVPVGY